MAYDYPGKGFHENSPGQMVRGKFWVPTKNNCWNTQKSGRKKTRIKYWGMADGIGKNSDRSFNVAGKRRDVETTIGITMIQNTESES